MLSFLTQPIRNASIRLKLVSMISLTCMVGMLLCCFGFMVNDLKSLRQAKMQRVEAQARMLAFNSAAVITFMQKESGEELLLSYEAEPTVEQAILYSVDGDIIASYPRRPDLQIPHLKDLPDGSAIDQAGKLHNVTPVNDAGERIGSLYVLCNMQDVQDQLYDYFQIACYVLLISMAVAFLLSIFVQGFISRPVTQLASTVEQIRQNEDFSVRVELDRQDELGVLYSAFNAMLVTVEKSKNDLRLANEHLEDRVDERTSQLQQEIEQREQTRQQLIAAKEEAENANLAKSLFLANMSHEIRTPMNAILGFTDLMRRQDSELNDEERESYLETVHRSGKHLLGLINDILDLSKIEANRMDLDLVEESPHQIVAEAISVMRVPALQKGLTLDYAWNGPVPRTVTTDPSRLRQLLLNLIGNAIKFTRRGGVRVSVEVADLDVKPALRIEVIDTGIGIPQQKLDEIFQPFTQADVSTTREFGGTGLGLTISRRIAEAMGGELAVSSSPGQGSVFTVMVPVGQIDRASLQSSAPVADIVVKESDQCFSEQEVNLKPGSILLVEDGQTNRRMVRLLLRSQPVTITDAENGAIAVDLATNQDFDLILMDMQMPVMDGYTATSQLREKGLQVPIIALTAHAMKGDREKCLSAGCTDYLTKPIDEDRLLNKLAEYLGTLASEYRPKTAPIQHSAASPTETSKPPEPVQQETAVISALPYDDPDYREIIDDFRTEIAQKLTEMTAAFDERAFDELARLAHWVKGTAGTAGFDQFTIPAIRLERHSKESKTEEVRAALDVLIDLAERIETGVPSASDSAESNLTDVRKS